MRRVLSEPLVWFVLLGVVLFAAVSFISGRRRSEAATIVVRAAQIDEMSRLFARRWQRPPSPTELEGLVDDLVRDEIAWREGVAIGLDREDTVIRRRMRQQIEFITTDLATRAEPTNAQLATYLAAHPDEFRLEPRHSFAQVYLDVGRRGDRLEDDVAALLARLNDEADLDPATIGDPIMLETTYADVARFDVARLFGDTFAHALEDVEPGAWRGPVRSGYGVHLVRIDARTPGRVPQLDEVRDAVRREWQREQRGAALETLYRNLGQRYDVVVQWPDADS